MTQDISNPGAVITAYETLSEIETDIRSVLMEEGAGRRISKGMRRILRQRADDYMSQALELQRLSGATGQIKHNAQKVVDCCYSPARGKNPDRNDTSVGYLLAGISNVKSIIKRHCENNGITLPG